MSSIFSRVFCICALVVCAFSVAVAAPVAKGESGTDPYRTKWQNASTEDLKGALNRLAHASISQSHEVKDEEVRLREIWRDPQYQTPKIAALQKRLLELEAEMLATRVALQKAADEIPAVKERRAAVNRKQSKIEEAVREREVVQAILREREADSQRDN